jgi:geranylgeranyl diphosphate synthase type I
MRQPLDIRQMRISIEKQLTNLIDCCIPEEYIGMKSMLAYHMGWEGVGAGPDAQGKRIRPMLVLLSAVAAGGDWEDALPAAGSVELIHNFSLIHDDIQDQSPLRRGRPTVWVKWGTAQAINAGDLMFTLAFSAIQKLKETVSLDAALEAYEILQATCVRLTGGQYLDLYNEKAKALELDAYWPMIGGKTAALLACCAELGALSAHAQPVKRQSFRDFGEKLGLAFQVQDDWLGIWGDAERTGKSTESDLVSGKKSLPVVYGLTRGQKFARRWLEGPILANEVPEIAKILEDEGVKDFTEKTANRLTKEALAALDQAAPESQGKSELLHLTESLLSRDF